MTKIVEEESDRLGQWFAGYDQFGNEVFSARLLFGTDELSIAWIGNARFLAGNIGEVQRMIGRRLLNVSEMASEGLSLRSRPVASIPGYMNGNSGVVLAENGRSGYPDGHAKMFGILSKRGSKIEYRTL